MCVCVCVCVRERERQNLQLAAKYIGMTDPAEGSCMSHELVLTGGVRVSGTWQMVLPDGLSE